MPRREPGRGLGARRAVYVSLALIVLFGAFLRLYKIDEIGLTGSDTVYYTNIAKSWSEGTVRYQAVQYQSFVYRPVVFAIFGAAMWAFGETDYAIKLANALVDSANIALVFAICWLLVGRALWPACSAALIYACSPMAVQLSRVEMTHVISAQMVLGALLFFLIHERSTGLWRRRIYLVLSALFTGLAVLSHEDLALTAVGYVGFLGLIFLRSPRARSDFETLVMSCLLFLGTFVC